MQSSNPFYMFPRLLSNHQSGCGQGGCNQHLSVTKTISPMFSYSGPNAHPGVDINAPNRQQSRGNFFVFSLELTALFPLTTTLCVCIFNIR